MNRTYYELKPHLHSRCKIQLERLPPSNPRLNGYLLGLSGRLGLMHCFHDFLPDGYTVFRLEDVESVRSSDCERHWDHMLSAEGLLTGLDCPLNVDLSSIQSTLTSASEQFEWLIIECEDLENDCEDFYIGKLIAAGRQETWFDNFDVMGQWDDEPHCIETGDITLIQFETVYLKTFSKYLTGVPSVERSDQ